MSGEVPPPDTGVWVRNGLGDSSSVCGSTHSSRRNSSREVRIGYLVPRGSRAGNSSVGVPCGVLKKGVGKQGCFSSMHISLWGVELDDEGPDHGCRP